METKKSAFHYAWVVLLATIAMNFFFSVVYSTFSLYAASVLEANPSITRTAYSIIPTLHSVSATIFLLLYGKIVQKVGFRWLMLIGGIGIAIGYFIYSIANSIVLFYVGAMFVGIFPAFCSSTTTGALINRWYGKLNTTLLSLSMAIGGFGGTLGSIIVGKWLDTIGYKASFRYMGLLMLAVMVVVFLVVRNNPAEMKATMLWPTEADKKATTQEERAGLTLNQALKTYNFWAMVLFFVLYAAGFYAAYANVAVYMADLGWSATTYGAIFSVVSTVNVITMVPGGFMADKLGPRGTIFILTVLFAVVCIVIGFTTPTVAMMYVVCALIGACYLFCKVLHTPLALCFGNRASASIISILTAAVTVGACIGIPTANIVYDATGSYAGLFRILLGVLLACLILAFTGIKKVPGWDKVGGSDALNK